MEAIKEVYVIALLGSSPAVVTETLWLLANVEGLRVRGLEIWTTGPAREAFSGAGKLKAMLEA